LLQLRRMLELRGSYLLVAFALPAWGCGSSASTAPSGDGGAAVIADADSAVVRDGNGAEAPPGFVSAPVVVRPPSMCPDGMALVGTYCMDRWEDYVVEIDAQGLEQAHSPYDVVDGLNVRAKTAPGVVPQGYISQVQAAQACSSAGKRLCSADEFHLACEGPDPDNWYPYGGETHIAGYCNEGKGSMVPVYYGSDPQTWTYADFNDPRLNQIAGGLAPTGTYPHCESPWGLFDCVGNLHEWGSDPADANGHGRFRGGFYGDAEVNGHGCLYVTSAHELAYHDYSTGFRCCADAVGTKLK
jgi:formylglycine-generating enzyme